MSIEFEFVDEVPPPKSGGGRPAGGGPWQKFLLALEVGQIAKVPATEKHPYQSLQSTIGRWKAHDRFRVSLRGDYVYVERLS